MENITAPIELHEFTWGSNTYQFTTSDRDYIDVENRLWKAEPIVRQSITESQAESRSTLKINMSISNPIVQPFKLSSPIVGYRLFQVDLEDPSQEKYFLFEGRVNDLVITPETSLAATLTATSLLVVLDDPGLRRRLQPRCPHSIYDTNCRVFKGNHLYSAVVSAVDGKTVTFSTENFTAKQDSFFSNGVAEYFRAEGGFTERRLIASYSGVAGGGTISSIVLDSPPIGLSVGDTVNMFPGCARTMQVCQDTFNNLPNFGGTPYAPQKDPFSTDSFT